MLEEKKPAVGAADEEPLEIEPIEEEKEPIEGQDPQVEKSPYQDELDRIEAERVATENRHKTELEAEKLEKQRLMEIKDKALADEKAKTRVTKDVWRDQTLSEVDRRLDIREAKTLVKGLTDDAAAQKVIMHYFETLPSEYRTGDVSEQLETAMALANRKRIASLVNQETMQDHANARSISSMGGGDLPGRSGLDRRPSPVAQTASGLLKMVAGRDTDRAKKLAERVTQKRK